MEKQKKVSEWKELMVSELTEKINKKTDFYISNYTGLKADEVNKLRRLLEPYSSEYFVLKNSIARIAFKNAGFSELAKLINGGVGMIIGGKDPLTAARVAVNFSKTHNSLKLKGGYLEGQIIDAAKINYIASLPTRNELIAKVVFSIKSPLSGFVNLLGNILRSLIFALQAIKDKKGG